MTEQTNDLVIISDYVDTLLKAGLAVPGDVIVSLRRLQRVAEKDKAVEAAEHARLLFPNDSLQSNIVRGR